MSENKSTRKFKIGDKKYQFCFVVFCGAFNDRFNKRREKEKLTQKSMEEELGKAVNVSADAVHSWRATQNGPADLETIKGIATFLEIDFMHLLEEAKEREETKMSKLNEKQTDSVKRIYDEILDFLGKFRNSCGFHDWVYNFGECNGTTKRLTIEKVDKVFYNVKIRLYKENFYLKGTRIYTELLSFIENDLCNMYDEVFWRKEMWANVDNEFFKALRKLDEIIQNYC